VAGYSDIQHFCPTTVKTHEYNHARLIQLILSILFVSLLACKKHDKIIIFITTAIYMERVHCFMSVNGIAVSC